MFFSTLALLGFTTSALAITINGPSSSAYWVQGTSNNITWSFSSGDPNPVDITVTNPNSTFLNGAFSIARNLDISNGSFTVTNVTLRVDTGYVVNFVNGSNQSQIFASSGSFEVKAQGTPPSNAPGSTNSSSGSSSSSGAASTATSPSGSGTASGSGSTSSSFAMSLRLGENGVRVVPMLAFTGLMTVFGAAITI